MAVIRVGAGQVDEFVGLVAQMNPPGRWDQDPDTERRLLLGTHPLCDGVEVRGYLARFGHSAVGRIGVTLPHDSDHALVGFLQAPGSGPVARSLFQTAAAVAAQHGRRVLLGPVDGSPWYRHWLTVPHRVDGDADASSGSARRYLGEPVDPPHHRDLWQAAGFREWVRRPSLLLGPSSGATPADPRVVHPRRPELAATLRLAPPLLLRSRAQEPICHSPSADSLAHAVQGFDRHTVWAIGPDGVLPRADTVDPTLQGVAIVLPDQLDRAGRRRLGFLPTGRADRHVLTHLAADDAGLRRALLSTVLAELSSRGGSLVCPPWLEPAVTRVHEGPTTVLHEHVLLRREL